jgi:hypothetical protein
MRLVLAPKVAVVEAEEDTAVAVVFNHRHSTYITIIT